MLRILGVDPGSRVTGFGLIEVSKDIRHLSHGVIQLDENKDIHSRLRTLGNDFAELLKRHQPQMVVVEKLFLGKNADSAFKLGQARGVVIYEALQHSCLVSEYATRKIKQGITGKGSATKEEVQIWLQKFLKIASIERLDASDALALAVFHAQIEKNQRLWSRQISQEL